MVERDSVPSREIEGTPEFTRHSYSYQIGPYLDKRVLPDHIQVNGRDDDLVLVAAVVVATRDDGAKFPLLSDSKLQPLERKVSKNGLRLRGFWGTPVWQAEPITPEEPKSATPAHILAANINHHGLVNRNRDFLVDQMGSQIKHKKDDLGIRTGDSIAGYLTRLHRVVEDVLGTPGLYADFYRSFRDPANSKVRDAYEES